MTSGEDDLERRVRKLAVEHAETRWLTLRLDDDIKEVREELRGHTATLAEHTAILSEHTAILAEHTAILSDHTATLADHTVTLAEHTARFDSVDAQLRSLTQLVGKVLDRLPEP